MANNSMPPVSTDAGSPGDADQIRRSAFRGCLLAGAVGDALGAGIEFMGLSEIHSRFGPGGIRDYVQCYGRLGGITDDTQMTLYTAEGLLRGYVRMMERGIMPDFSSVTAHAYLRWLLTQGTHSPLLEPDEPDGWLSRNRELFSRRAPGITCLRALTAMKSFADRAENDSKGCGGVMRAAPVGLFMSSWLAEDQDQYIGITFQLGCDVAAITHGHPSGQLTAGVLALMVGLIAIGAPLAEALDKAVRELQKHDHHDETYSAVCQARELAGSAMAPEQAIMCLGEGWIAEEALAIAVYCVLRASNLERCIMMAVNHSGDSDSTGAIAGNILGAQLGEQAIPVRWLAGLELHDTITAVADDLSMFRGWRLPESPDEGAEDNLLWNRYPGW